LPILDVSEILVDPDFLELGLLCFRQSQTVGENGLAVNTPTTHKFAGVVTAVSGYALERTSDGERIAGTILIVTRFRLRDGTAGYSADIVQRWSRRYVITLVSDYSRYGAGFVEAEATLLPLAGTTSVPSQ
jgi:galactose-6-phosphate isomerase